MERRYRTGMVVLLGGLVMFSLGLVLRGQSGSAVANSVFVSVEGYTNRSGARFAEAVLTNRGPERVRVWAWASFQGPLPAKFGSKHEPSEHCRLLSGGDAFHVLVPAPQDGTRWCAEFEVSADNAYVTLVQKLRSPRYEWIKGALGIREPEVGVEVVHSESRAD